MGKKKSIANATDSYGLEEVDSLPPKSSIHKATRELIDSVKAKPGKIFKVDGAKLSLKGTLVKHGLTVRTSQGFLYVSFEE